MFLADIKRASDTAQQEAAELRKRVEQPGTAPAGGQPNIGDAVENWVRDPKTGKLVKQ
jgi:hypothetical protein